MSLLHRGWDATQGRAFIGTVEPLGAVVDELYPALTTTYRRSTLVLGDGEARITIDADVAWRIPKGATTSLPDIALIETKTHGPPSDVDRALWRRGIRPTTISKYCTGLAALRPELPANRWHRVLERHLGRRGAPRSAHRDDAKTLEGGSNRIAERCGEGGRLSLDAPV